MVEFTVQQPITVGTILNQPLVTITGSIPVGPVETISTIENAPLVTVQGTVSITSLVATVTSNITVATIAAIGTIENAPLLTVTGSLDVLNLPRSVSTSGAVQSFDVQVSTLSTQVSTDTSLIMNLTILAEQSNTGTLFVGSATMQTFPLKAGASLTLSMVQPSNVYLLATATQQTAHIIYGGD